MAEEKAKDTFLDPPPEDLRDLALGFLVASRAINNLDEVERHLVLALKRAADESDAALTALKEARTAHDLQQIAMTAPKEAPTA